MNIEQKKAELKAKHELEVKKLDLEFEAQEKTGLRVIVMSIKWLLFRDVKEVAPIIEAYPPTINAELGFAGKDSIPTDSPFLLSISNYKHNRSLKDAIANLKYKSGNIDISIDLPYLDFKIQWKNITKNSKALRPKTYPSFYLDIDLKLQRYASDYLTYYGTTEQFKELLGF